RAYEYNSANRLINFALGEPPNTLDTTFTYNGLGDRLTQTVSGQETTYTLDLAAGLTQVLNDETYTYLYGNTRLAQLNTGTLNTEYFLPDALGSVRQIVAADGEVILVESYQPYGETLHSYGDSASPYGFAGEYTDSQSGLQYLRARYYAPGIARFLTRDTWAGEYTRSLSLNKWMYVEGNPVNFSDPNGQTPHPPNGNIAAPNVTAWLREQMEAHYKYGLELRAETQNIKIRTNAYWATLLNSCGPYPDLFKVAPNQPFRGLVNNFTVFGGTKIGYLPATTEVQHLPAQWIAQIASTAVGMPAQALGELLQETNTVNLLSMLEFAAYGLAVNYAQVKFTPTPNTIIDPDDGHNKNIVTVCGKAIDASDIGNIMFGLGGHARGFDWSVVYPSAALFNGLSGQGSGVLGPDARGATVGWWIGATQSWTTEASMCNTLNAWEWHGYHDNADQLANWTPSQVKLKSAVAFEPSSLQRVSDETYIFTELKNKLGFLPFVP
ncbi:MAG TPA: RHS repeat-associated core domain-containing protein, partial [Anaerolineales bacterium]|nr:RHS repeat-associated core domain-containing protein [Anaerolineales bacterium]